MLEHQSNQYIQSLAYQLAKQGNSCNGDSFYMKATENYYICVVADGLGSGQHAHDSSNAIKEVVEKRHSEEIDVLMDACNQSLKLKRGATVSILRVDFHQKLVSYCSVGNIQFAFYNPPGLYIYPIPVNGFLSGKPQTYRIETFPYEKESKFIIHTDGLHPPSIKRVLADFQTIEGVSSRLQPYTKARKDDATFVVGQLL
ncbi:PP2C family serine/threonine-protein phosphatase [Bacillus sp. MRMR6]|uniref:PP2C family serine/threonine-protein phosphatase n=1 Tax=Bacillus sp. MRMR6 TaxID=1928617 RepID=UPI000951F99E|nr:PP2C family serine/threonine-protein phosphatase [Bacillus sp. MRMR6]OLS41166.1 phosphoserine phosphatase [Bacillus sp. MRMR6]